MNSTEEALIRALGLPPETSARRLATSTASVSDVADAASVRRSAQQLVANLTLFAASVWSGPTAGSEAVGALDARRHAEHPAVVVIDGSAGRVLKITGAVTAFEIDEGGAAPREVDVPGIPRDDAILCLDARSGAAGVALETSSGILLVHNDHGTLTTSVLDTGSNAVDFSDFRPAAPLARDLASERTTASTTAPLLLSLSAEIEARHGNLGAALTQATTAWHEVRAARVRQPWARAHLPVVADRLARIAAKAGRPDLAREALVRDTSSSPRSVSRSGPSTRTPPL